MLRLALAFVTISVLASSPAQAAPLARHLGAPTLPQLYRHKPRASRAARSRSLAGSSRELFDLVTAAAIRHGVPVRLAHAIVRIESGYRCNALNRSGASGIMQVLPGTAAGVGVSGNLRDCATGLEAGMRYLGQAVRLGGAGCAGASLYNSGLAARPRCTGYGRNVLAAMGPAS